MNLFFPRVRCGKWVGNVVVDQTLRATTPQRIERRGSSGAHSRIGSYCPKELRKMERVEHFDVPSRSILSKKLNPLGDDVVTCSDGSNRYAFGPQYRYTFGRQQSSHVWSTVPSHVRATRGIEKAGVASRDPGPFSQLLVGKSASCPTGRTYWPNYKQNLLAELQTEPTARSWRTWPRRRPSADATRLRWPCTIRRCRAGRRRSP